MTRSDKWDWEKAHTNNEAIRTYRRCIVAMLAAQEPQLQKRREKAEAEFDPEEHKLRQGHPSWQQHLTEMGRRFGAETRHSRVVSLVKQLKAQRPAPSAAKRKQLIANILLLSWKDWRVALTAWDEAFGKSRGNKSGKARKRRPKHSEDNPYVDADISDLRQEIVNEDVMPVYERIQNFKNEHGIPRRHHRLPADIDAQIAVDYWFGLVEKIEKEQTRSAEQETMRLEKKRKAPGGEPSQLKKDANLREYLIAATVETAKATRRTKSKAPKA